MIKAIIYLLVGVSVLLIGIKMMGGGLKKLTGSGVKRFFRKTKDNPIASMGIGTLVTSAIQSSDATNAMVVGFVDSGSMTPYQGLCIMLGAYIGTTITGIIASFSSFSISLYLLIFVFIGALMMFINNTKVNYIGEMLAGLGLLFFGIATMKESCMDESIISFFKSIFNKISFGPLLFLLGFILTAFLQSSSALTSIIIALAGSGAVSLDCSLFIVLGSTLGTVTNTLLCASSGGVKGKRIAAIAFTLRTISSLVMLIILMILRKPISSLFLSFSVGGTNEVPVALFNVFYNLLFMPMLLPLLKPFIKLFDKVIKDKETDELGKAVSYINDRLLVNSVVAASEAKKEIVHMLDLAFTNYKYGYSRIIGTDLTHDNELNQIEEQIDYLNKAVTQFLIKVSFKADEETEHKIGSYFHVVNDIERIGDHAYNFYTMSQNMNDAELSFSSKAIEELNLMNSYIEPMFGLTKQIFESKDKSLLSQLHEFEEHTDDLKQKFFENHYKRIVTEECSDQLTPFISSFITDLERIADHLTNIGYSIVNPTGDE